MERDSSSPTQAWCRHPLCDAYAYGDTSAGRDASYQTGWTGCIVTLLQRLGHRDGTWCLVVGRSAVCAGSSIGDVPGGPGDGTGTGGVPGVCGRQSGACPCMGLGQRGCVALALLNTGGTTYKPRHDLLATSVHLSWPYTVGLDLTSNGAA